MTSSPAPIIAGFGPLGAPELIILLVPVAIAVLVVYLVTRKKPRP